MEIKLYKEEWTDFILRIEPLVTKLLYHMIEEYKLKNNHSLYNKKYLLAKHIKDKLKCCKYKKSIKTIDPKILEILYSFSKDKKKDNPNKYRLKEKLEKLKNRNEKLKKNLKNL